MGSIKVGGEVFKESRIVDIGKEERSQILTGESVEVLWVYVKRSQNC